jgi:hypothetical protein
MNLKLTTDHLSYVHRVRKPKEMRRSLWFDGRIPSLLGELHSAKQNIEIWLSRPVMKKRPAADFTAR